MKDEQSNVKCSLYNYSVTVLAGNSVTWISPSTWTIPFRLRPPCHSNVSECGIVDSACAPALVWQMCMICSGLPILLALFRWPYDIWVNKKKCGSCSRTVWAGQKASAWRGPSFGRAGPEATGPMPERGKGGGRHFQMFVELISWCSQTNTLGFDRWLFWGTPTSLSFCIFFYVLDNNSALWLFLLHGY